MTLDDGLETPTGAVGAIGILLADGRLPTGGHAHSLGLEAAVAVGDVVDIESLARFAAGRLDTQGRVEAAFAAAAARAWGAEDRDAALASLVVEFDARTPSPHLRSTSRTLGRHLLRAASHILDDPASLQSSLRDTPRPIVAGAVAAASGLPPSYAAAVECHHLVSGVCASAVKLLGLDPLATVRVQSDLARHIDRIVAAQAAPVAPPLLAAAAPARSEILAEWHAAETSRLFAT